MPFIGKSYKHDYLMRRRCVDRISQTPFLQYKNIEPPLVNPCQLLNKIDAILVLFYFFMQHIYCILPQMS